MLTSDGEPADMDGYRDDDLGIPGGLPCLGVGIAGLHPFPLGPAVLEPDFHLHLAELEGRARSASARSARGTSCGGTLSPAPGAARW